jgi:hypothetical protein
VVDLLRMAFAPRNSPMDTSAIARNTCLPIRVPIPAAGAWLDSSTTLSNGAAATQQSGHRLGRHTGYSCLNFTSNNPSARGTYLLPNGSSVYGFMSCEIARPLACCNGAPQTAFAGLTPNAYSGDMGGRPAVHEHCNDAFPGAHLCFGAEYLRAYSSVPIPFEGAWLDYNIDESGNGSAEGSGAYGRATGWSCASYTATSGLGAYLQPNGAITTGNVCNSARRIACCY